MNFLFDKKELEHLKMNNKFMKKLKSRGDTKKKSKRRKKFYKIIPKKKRFLNLIDAFNKNPKHVKTFQEGNTKKDDTKESNNKIKGEAPKSDYKKGNLTNYFKNKKYVLKSNTKSKTGNKAKEANQNKTRDIFSLSQNKLKKNIEQGIMSSSSSQKVKSSMNTDKSVDIRKFISTSKSLTQESKILKNKLNKANRNIGKTKNHKQKINHYFAPKHYS